jgi:transposase
MDAIEQLKQDVRDGKVDLARLIDVIVTLQRQLETTLRQLEAAQQRIEELEKRLGGPAAPTSAKVDEAFSLRAEEKRQQARDPKKNKLKLSRKGRRGRLTNADKLKLAERTEKCFPEGVCEPDCWLSHTRPVWRLEKGRALVVAYEIYRGPSNQYGKIPGVLGRSEFGVEIVVEIAYFVYVLGLSFDKVCQMLQFLQNLALGKTQADALLRQLSRHWQQEFEVLCTLLANSMVVHADETRWSINSVWAILSEKARVLLFGVHKDAETLEKILDPAAFAGIVISDDAAVYANFTQAQKCWAHLLRKAIKLTLQEPNNLEYRHFTDRLLEVYRSACRVQKDGRRSPAGRARKVQELDDEILELCVSLWALELPPLAEGPENDYRLLVNEVMRLMLDQQLFTFVTAEPATQPNGACQPVAGTNNEAERTLRTPAAARDTGRANKTLVGARRQTILVSVLESLRVYLKTFTLANVIAEIERWRQAGESCFSKLLRKLKLNAPATSILDKLIPDG